jgi:hypothetical protein
VRYIAIVALVALSLVALGGSEARAGFDEGLDAYNHGDFAAALREWLPLAGDGHAQAQFNVGVIYARGEGVALDYGEAMVWIRRSAEQGLPAAAVQLGLMYRDGLGVGRDAGEAARWFRGPAGEGDANAQHLLGMVLANQGAAASREEGWSWIRRAADAGHAGAQFTIAMGHDTGGSLSEDRAAAAGWYLLAAEQAHPRAQFRLGMMYLDGRGVARDYGRAEAWLWFAADRGFPMALYNLGLIYLEGRGFEADRVEAAGWFSLAVLRLPTGAARDAAIRSRDHAVGLLTPDQRAQALERARAWLARHGG